MSYQIVEPVYIEPLDLLAPPINPSPYDDEFDGVSLDSAWTRGGGPFDDVNPIDPSAAITTGLGSRSSHNSYRKSWYMVQPQVGTATTGITKPISFASECFIWARMSFTHRVAAQTNGDGNIALSFTIGYSFIPRLSLFLNESDANTIQMQMDDDVTGGVALSNNVGGAGTVAVGQVVHTVGLQKLGTTYHTWGLSAAGNWLHMTSAVNAAVFTHATFSLETENSTAPGNAIYGFDFFRYKAGRSLP
jgi:hypothetical protein